MSEKKMNPGESLHSLFFEIAKGIDDADTNVASWKSYSPALKYLWEKVASKLLEKTISEKLEQFAESNKVLEVGDMVICHGIVTAIDIEHKGKEYVGVEFTTSHPLSNSVSILKTNVIGCEVRVIQVGDSVCEEMCDTYNYCMVIEVHNGYVHTDSKYSKRISKDIIVRERIAEANIE